MALNVLKRTHYTNIVVQFILNRAYSGEIFNVCELDNLCNHQALILYSGKQNIKMLDFAKNCRHARRFNIEIEHFLRQIKNGHGHNPLFPTAFALRLVLN